MRQQGLGAFDGPSHELGKIGDIQREISEMTLGLEIAAIDVDDIRQRLKGIKRDSDGQNYVQNDIVLLGVKQPYDSRHALQNEVDVFEEYKRP